MNTPTQKNLLIAIVVLVALGGVVLFSNQKKTTQGSGTIVGKVTVGPICPVERVDVPCPVPPEAYTSREVILYESDGTTIVERMHFASDGTYRFSVPAGTYVISIPQEGVGGSSEVPKTLTVQEGETVEFNFSIDTGIR
jgi:hypothetical protein